MSILSELPDGLGYYYGFSPPDHRRIDVRCGPVDLLWRAYVAAERIGGHETGVFDSKSEAERAALQWMMQHPQVKIGEDVE